MDAITAYYFRFGVWMFHLENKVQLSCILVHQQAVCLAENWMSSSWRLKV